MAQVDTGRHGGAAGRGRPTGTWAVVAVLLAIGIVVPLLVFLYDSEKPTLWGFPFYYWFQFAMIPVVSALTFAAFRLSLRATAQERPAFGLPPEPPTQPPAQPRAQPRPEPRADGTGPDEREAR